MRTITLTRYESTRAGTFGHIRLDYHTWHTVERQWIDNWPFISCIPSGAYTLTPHESDRHGSCFSIIGGSVALAKSDLEPPVITRYAVLMHSANFSSELAGCIAPGMYRGAISGSPAVMSSRTALGEIGEAIGWEPAQLLVLWTG